MIGAWPEWGWRLVSTAIVVAAAYGVGHLVKVILDARLRPLAARTPEDWDDALVRAITRRVPFWSLLVGIYLALPSWPLADEPHRIAVRILSGLGVLSVTMALASVASRLVAAYGPRASPGAPVSALSQNVVRIVILALGALVIIRSFGYDITPWLTALGVGGLAVALALQDPLSNLFAGIFIAIAADVRIGDYVRLDSGAEGYIADLTWRSTRLRQLGDNLVIVPNAKIAQAVVTNFSRPSRDMGIGVEVTLDPTVDLDVAEKTALRVAGEVMSSVAGGVPAAEPSVRFQTFTDTGVRMAVGVRVRAFADQFLVKHELVKHLHAAFTREGVSIAVTTRPVAPKTSS
ncbi:MAG TPA: mechanosensitive ion channel family protein [Vicinamibacterales bacterium]|nr:mechanosensitive ion channel family protein [Vicinamibacterales bacterium]